jgi:hypothetical protein
MGSLGLLVQLCLSRVRPPRLVIFEKVLLFWFFQNEPLGVKGAIVTKAQICKVHVSLEPIGSDYREPIGYSYNCVDIVNPLGRITLVNLVTRNPERLETMNPQNRYRQCWPDTETPEPAKPSPIGFVVRVILAAACIYLLTVFALSL